MGRDARWRNIASEGKTHVHIFCNRESEEEVDIMRAVYFDEKFVIGEGGEEKLEVERQVDMEVESSGGGEGGAEPDPAIINPPPASNTNANLPSPTHAALLVRQLEDVAYKPTMLLRLSAHRWLRIRTFNQSRGSADKARL
jgi:hypothetical protein